MIKNKYLWYTFSAETLKRRIWNQISITQMSYAGTAGVSCSSAYLLYSWRNDSHSCCHSGWNSGARQIGVEWWETNIEKCFMFQSIADVDDVILFSHQKLPKTASHLTSIIDTLIAWKIKSNNILGRFEFISMNIPSCFWKLSQEYSLFTKYFGWALVNCHWALFTASFWSSHYNDVIMSRMVCQVTSFLIVCSTVCSGTDQRKHQSSASQVTGEFWAQRASNAEKISIWWGHHGSSDVTGGRQVTIWSGFFFIILWRNFAHVTTVTLFEI